MMLRIPSHCRWKDYIALCGSIPLHWVAELMAFSILPFHRTPPYAIRTRMEPDREMTPYLGGDSLTPFSMPPPCSLCRAVRIMAN